MASSRSGSTGSKRGGAIDLADEDRRYLSESLGNARGAGAASGDESEGGLFEALERFGLSSSRVERLRGAFDDMDVRESVEKAQEYLADQIESARDYARDNPKKVIGGAAGVLVGASLLAMALRRASGEDKRRSSGGGSSSSSGGGSSSGSSSSSSSSRSTSSKRSSGGGSKKRSSGSSGGSSSSTKSSGGGSSSSKSSKSRGGSKKSAKRR